MLPEVSFGAPTIRNVPLTARDSPYCPAVVLKLGEPFPVLVRKIDGYCFEVVEEEEVTEVVCPVTMVTVVVVDDEVEVAVVDVEVVDEVVDVVDVVLVVVVEV